MTVKTAAERLEVSQSTIYALVGSGVLRCTRIGLKRGCIRISEEQINEYLKEAESVRAPRHDYGMRL
jgi:excisionase family DNA binding protein